ncbi:eukaryotic translation initiation factor NCBP [Physcomitrium patens]|uniref:mRNA cap-binding protein n=1 Tax=Physcomitrium patens TaxID=3218 RepID=A0A2K1KPS1_PHYPA|nr:eukaryotic translation initiation factor NCBP-like [Physcomitrium patens]PNR55785.1 hypothetical protein PHYPA_006682 [Physcomitrium patens]|eukprot:XP_024374008.1 eukaryotic translation initiation factor NCBP-like [Physcomitrella patens]
MGTQDGNLENRDPTRALRTENGGTRRCNDVLAMIGDQLDYGDTVCGAVLSIRFGEDILSVWNRNAADNQVVMALRDSIKRHLQLSFGYMMEYKPHDASLRDNSSFRNTWLRG